MSSSIKKRRESLVDAREIDAKAIHESMGRVETDNRKIQENAAYDKVQLQLEDLRKKSGSLSKKMATLLEKKAKAITKAKFPIDGLAVGDDGVTFDGIPLAQCSTSQQIRTSVAIGLAMNPKLRVLLIREGSLLDTDNLAMVAQMAEEADAQIWLERVSQGDECSVIMEDGAIKESKE